MGRAIIESVRGTQEAVRPFQRIVHHARKLTLCAVKARSVPKRTLVRGGQFRSMVDNPLTIQLGIRMNDTPKPLSAAAIHSVYSGEKIVSAVDQAKNFKSTNRFARDVLHSGQAPTKNKVEGKRSGRS